MGLIGKLIGTAVVTVAAGASVAGSLLKGKEKKLKDLELDFEETKFSYQNERELLLRRIEKGDRRAEKKLKELDHQFKMDQIEYESERRKLLPKETGDSKIAVEEKTIREEPAHRESDTKATAETAVETEICAFCNKAISPEAKFCPYCGNAVNEKNVKAFCANCGEELTPDSMFCSNCGHAV